MKKIITLATMVATFVFAAPNCNFDKSMRSFEKRMGLPMSGAKITKTIATGDDEVSVIQKISKPIKSGQYMGLRQFAVYGFIGCELKDVRTGKLSKSGDVVAEATVHLRPDGNLKASCKGSGDVIFVNPFTYEIEPNTECICYDDNSLERRPSGKIWCAEAEDFDKDRLVIPSIVLDFIDPNEKKVDNSGLSVQVVEPDCYFHESDMGARKSKKILRIVLKNIKKLAKSVDAVEGEDKQGKVTIKLGISADGSVSGASVVSSTVLNNEAKETVREFVQGLDFGKASGESSFFLVLKIQ